MDARYNSGMRVVRWVTVAILTLVSCSLAQTQNKPDAKVPVTEISADLGPCSADFHVIDMAGNAIYNAKITTTIRYGFLSKRRLDLQVGTNSNGRARFVKLPDELKKPVEFTITNGVDTATRSYDPGTNCHSAYDVPLKTTPKS